MKPALLLMPFVAAILVCSPLPAQEGESVLDQAKKLSRLLGSDNSSYLRVVKGKTASRLETACVTFENVDTGLSVTLVAAVHIGDKSYYKALQKHLEGYDKVFYEGVERDKKASNLLSLVSRMQAALKDSLGLAFQPEHMDMSKKNMVRADLKASELEAMFEKQGISLLPNQDLVQLFGPLVEKGLRLLAPAEGKEPNSIQLMMRRRLKGVFADALSKGLSLYDKVKEPEDRARDALLIGARNDRALALLKQEAAQQPKGRYAILYGGAHHPDFERRLLKEWGLQKTGTIWLKAWDMSPKAEKPEKPTSKPREKRDL